MAPAAVATDPGPVNGHHVKPLSKSTTVENPNRNSNTKTSYHSSSTQQAIDDESAYAAHNYHPLPVVFSKAAGVSVWDPEGRWARFLDGMPR